MPLFRYEVTDRGGKTLRGAMDAVSEVEVRQRLSGQGYLVNLVISTATPQQASRPRPQVAPVPIPVVGPTSRATAPDKEMAVLFRGLASFLIAGVTLYEALMQIAAQSPNRGMRRICEQVAHKVQSGESLNRAMAGFPRAFPPHILGAVAAGELGGFLPIMIGDVALDYEIAQRRSKRLHKWFIGLGWINAVGTLAIAPSLRLMLPEFANGAILQGIIKWLTFSTKFILLPCGLIYVLFLAMAFALRQPGVQPLAQSMVLRVPWVGRASRERSLASFSRILWRLQKAGILPIQAWQAACSVCENVIIASRLGQQIPALRSGLKLSDAFAATGYFTGEDQRVLALGEQTGQSVDVLERISAYYEDAALSSAGSASRLGIHIMVIANILALGIAVYCMVPLVLQWEMQWAEQF